MKIRLISLAQQRRPDVIEADSDLSDIQALRAGSSRPSPANFCEAINSNTSNSAFVLISVDLADYLDDTSATDAEHDETVEGISEGIRKLSIDTPANRYHGKSSTLILMTAVADLRKRTLEAQHRQLPPPRPREGIRQVVSGNVLSESRTLS